MNRLTKTLTALSLAVVLALPFAGLASAAKFWNIDISIPATQGSKTFNVQYTTLSTESTDVIDVDLYQNGVKIAGQTTIPAGDSGAFAVTVPTEGTYEYYIVGDNDGDSQTTDTVSVKVVAPPTEVNTVTVPNPNGSTNGSSGSNGQSGDSSSSDGQVDASGNSTDNQSSETLGESKKDDNKNNDSKTAWTIIIIAAIVALIYANRKRFMPGEDK